VDGALRGLELRDARGVQPATAKRIFHDLSRYGVGEKERPMLVVAQPGKPPAFTSYSGRNVVYIDDIIMPEDTRPRLIQALEMLQNKRDKNPPKKHGNIPL